MESLKQFSISELLLLTAKFEEKIQYMEDCQRYSLGCTSEEMDRMSALREPYYNAKDEIKKEINRRIAGVFPGLEVSL